MKTNTISVISVHIRFVYIPNDGDGEMRGRRDGVRAGETIGMRQAHARDKRDDEVDRRRCSPD